MGRQRVAVLSAMAILGACRAADTSRAAGPVTYDRIDALDGFMHPLTLCEMVKAASAGVGLFEVASLIGATEADPSRGGVLDGFTYVGLNPVEEWVQAGTPPTSIRIFGGPKPNGFSSGWLVTLEKGELVAMILSKGGPDNRGLPTVGPQRVFHRDAAGKFTNKILFKDGVASAELKTLVLAIADQPGARCPVEAVPGPFDGGLGNRPANLDANPDVADPACGGENQGCCEKRRCGEGRTCVNVRTAGDRCLRCGSAGGPCCTGGTCSSGCCARSPTDSTYTCVQVGQSCPALGACQATGECSGNCGATGQACCVIGTDSWCYAPGMTCAQLAGQPGDCVPCGKAGQPCCLAQVQCADNLVCRAAPPSGARQCDPP